MVTIPSISTKRTITSHFHLLNKKGKQKYHEVGNSGTGLVYAKQCGGVKPVNGILILNL
jgi:hypothetical protein